MENAIVLPEELRELVENGTLEANRDGTYSIHKLAHRLLTATGWADAIYWLEVEEQDDGLWFEVVEQDESVGSDTVLSSSDADDVAAWIYERVNDAEN